MQEQTKYIVNYQEIDKDLKALEDQINGSDEAKKYYTARKFLSTVEESLTDLDKRAQFAIENYNASVSEFESLLKEVKEYEKAVDGCQDEGELEYLKKKFSDALDKINQAQQKVENASKTMADLYKEYSKLGSQNKVMMAQYKEFKPKYEELKNSKLQEINALKAKLKEIEGKIDSALMEKYMVRRKDKKFPVVFGLDLDKKLNYCPFCATQMPMNFMEELNSGVIKECESCHRLIYGFTTTKKK